MFDGYKISFVLVVLVVTEDGVDSKIDIGPTNSLKKVNESVNLNCVTNKENCNGIDWKKQEGNASPKPVYQDGPGMLNPDQFPAARYSVSPEGGCTLKITNLTLGDSGKFICIETANGGQDTKSAVLVVIGTDLNACVNNPSEVVKGDSYVVQCAVSVPPKTTEPTSVILSLYAGGANPVASSSSGELQNSNLTLVVSYSAITEGKEVPKYRCSASFSPESQPNYDTTTAKIDRVCETPAKTVLFSVTNIRTLPKHSDNKVRSGDNCTADGSPPPTYVWINTKSGGRTWSGTNFTMNPADMEMDNFTCTASNTVKGEQHSLSITVSGTTTQAADEDAGGGGLSGGAIVGIIIGLFLLGGGVAAGVYFGHKYLAEKKGSENIEKPPEAGTQLLTKTTPSKDTDSGMPSAKAPDKPPRLSENVHHRNDQWSDSDATEYAQLRPDTKPHQMSSDTKHDSTVYTPVKVA